MKMCETLPEFLTREDLARHLGFSTGAIKNYHRKGVLAKNSVLYYDNGWRSTTTMTGTVKMMALAEILIRARTLGVQITERTFWRYHAAGLVEKGRKLPGRGNVLYFPPDTYKRLWVIHYLTRELGSSLGDLQVVRGAWDLLELPAELPRLPLDRKTMTKARWVAWLSVQEWHLGLVQQRIAMVKQLLVRNPKKSIRALARQLSKGKSRKRRGS